MTVKLTTFDAWTPPWKADEFDADKAAKLIFNLHKDKETLSDRVTVLGTEKDEALAKVTAFEEKDLSEAEKLRKENERLKAEKDAGKGKAPDDLRADRLEIALEKGLTKAQALRLHGDTREDLEADADAYLEENGITAGSGGQAPPTQRAQVKGKIGSKQKPDEVDEYDDMDPGAMYDKVHGITT